MYQAILISPDGKDFVTDFRHSKTIDDVWKAMAIKVGARPERCYNSEVVNQPESKYIAECKGCGTIHRRHKRRRGNRMSSCAKCSNGVFNPEFVLHYIPNPKLNLVVSF